MSKIKADLLKDIEAAIKKKKELQKRIATNSVDNHVLEFINYVDDLTSTIKDQDVWLDMVEMEIGSLSSRIEVIDPGSRVEVSWHTSESEKPRINGVLIKWSKDYQARANCEPEIFVDLTSLLFK